MFTMKFKTDNAAFDGQDKPEEVANILSGIAQSIREGYPSGGVYDSNGNRVGEWRLT